MEQLLISKLLHILLKMDEWMNGHQYLLFCIISMLLRLQTYRPGSFLTNGARTSDGSYKFMLVSKF
jgi:hypothetical protein